MNSNLHCTPVFGDRGYFAQWMMNDLVLFSAKAKEIFKLDNETEKKAIDKLLELHGNETIFDMNIEIEHLTGSTTVFCPLEEFEPLCDKLLVVLKEIGQPSQWGGSFEQCLDTHRKSNEWKDKWTKITSLVVERRRKELIKKLDECTNILAQDPAAKESVKRKRADLEEVVGLLEQRIKRSATVSEPMSVPVVNEVPISEQLPAKWPKRSTPSVAQKSKKPVPVDGEVWDGEGTF